MCAFFIKYNQNGRIIESCSKDDLIAAYRLVQGKREQISHLLPKLISYKEHAFGITGLIKTADIENGIDITSEPPSIEEIMIYHEKREAVYEKSAV